MGLHHLVAGVRCQGGHHGWQWRSPQCSCRWRLWIGSYLEVQRSYCAVWIGLVVLQMGIADVFLLCCSVVSEYSVELFPKTFIHYFATRICGYPAGFLNNND